MLPEVNTNNKITIQINFFGPYLKKEEIPQVLAKTNYPWIESHISLLEFFFDLPISALSSEILERYVEITTKETHISIVPHTKEIFERLLKPLKSAKKNYCLGEYSATMALCGVVGEMLAILLWKINDVRLKGQPISAQDEKGLFGKTFEELGQEKKLRILRTFGHIDEVQYADFCSIKKSRNLYLHSWSSDFSKEKEEALAVFLKTLQLFKQITGIGFADAGKVKINPLLFKLFRDGN